MMIVIIIIANTFKCYCVAGTSLSTYCLHILTHFMLMAALPRRYSIIMVTHILRLGLGTEAFNHLNAGSLAPESMLFIITLF